MSFRQAGLVAGVAWVALAAGLVPLMPVGGIAGHHYAGPDHADVKRFARNDDPSGRY